MSETRCDRDLATEALCTNGRTKVFVKNLDCDATLMFHVAGEEDSGHTALSQLTLYIITTTERSLQSFEQLIQIEYPFGGRCQRIQ